MLFICNAMKQMGQCNAQTILLSIECKGLTTKLSAHCCTPAIGLHCKSTALQFKYNAIQWIDLRTIQMSVSHHYWAFRWALFRFHNTMQSVSVFPPQNWLKRLRISHLIRDNLSCIWDLICFFCSRWDGTLDSRPCQFVSIFPAKVQSRQK